MEFKNYQLIDRAVEIVKSMLSSDNNGTTEIRAVQIAETLEIVYNKLVELDTRSKKENTNLEDKNEKNEK